MMPTFPNIVPTIGTKPSANHETAKLPSAHGKKDESFASLMTLILSPAGFASSAKGSKSGAPGPGKDHGKTTDAEAGGDPNLDASQTALPDANAIMLACPQPVFTPAPALAATKADQKNDPAVEGESPAKVTPEIFSADLKAELTAEPAKVPSPKTVAKNVAERVVPADLKIPSSNVSAKPSNSKPVAPVKIDEAETTAPLAKAITPEKFSPAVSPAENQEATPVSITKPAASSIPMAAPAPIISAKSASAPVARSTDEATIKTVDLKQTELAPKTTFATVATVVTPATVAISATAQPVQVESFPAEAEVEDIGQPSPDASGTSIAKEDAAMKKADKLNKFAGATEKILPGNATVMARENSLPARADQSDGNAAVDAATSATSGRDGMVPLMTADAVAGSAAVDSRSRILENAHELVAQHAVRLNGSGGDSLQVVIRPGAGTQLSLELRRHGDGVEVQAVLQQGDFAHLNQNWPELQQRLEQRGIRLAPLTGDVNFAAGNGGHAFQQKPNQPAEAFAEFTPAFSMAGTFARPAAAATHRGWETWA